MTSRVSRGRIVVWLAWLCAAAALGGCTRTHYRVRADREAYTTLALKTAGTPWAVSPDYSVMPDPRSRFFDPTPMDDPQLPMPAPQLYAYQLPELPPGNSRRQAVSGAAEERIETSQPPFAPVHVAGTPPWPVRQVAFQAPPYAPPHAPPNANLREEIREESPMVESMTDVAPIPEAIWQSIPDSCLRRMFEFASVREEYQRTFGTQPPPDQRDSSQRLGLEEILQLAQINARDYQTQKESLYQAALRLSVERFDYDMKFSTGGNRHVVDYTHDRNGGETVNRLRLPTTLAADKLLVTGGDLVARFANSVVLTFNGPDGFAADVGSDLLFDISQNVLQRDVIFEGLTQAERTVVYQARDLARFRKELFQRLAAQYYSLLLNYRRIEIDTQDYFSNLRGWLQTEAEYRADRRLRFEVDQFEQRSLESRSRLIGTCNSLERSLDQLKLRVGLPPETPINLDLSELEELTLRDEAAALEERVRRSRRNLLVERQTLGVERIGVLLNGAIDLVDKAIKMMEVRQRLSARPVPIEELQQTLDELRVEEIRLDVRFNRTVLRETLEPGLLPADQSGEAADPGDAAAAPDAQPAAPDAQAAPGDAAAEPNAFQMPPAPPLQIFQRTMDLIDSLLALIERQQLLLQRRPDAATVVPETERIAAELRSRYTRLQADLEVAVNRRELDQIPLLVDAAKVVLDETRILAEDVSRMLGMPELTPEQLLDWTIQRVDQLLDRSGQYLAADETGLKPVEIDMDEAMLTALTLRFNLMNEREQLADSWRRIKLAGDDLKSVLNLQASQQIRTNSDHNRPFDFTTRDSQTRLTMSFDAPLNRLAQRNEFRRSLINYNAALRNLIALEDETKVAVRDVLRDLQVDREQYRISVASAALAFERVVTTNLQLQQGVKDVTARDVFEAQQDYTRSLNAVAAAHIAYLLNRIQLFMDLELLQVDDQGFWPELYEEGYQPEPNFQLPYYGVPAYGELPPGLLFSHRMRRMEHVPAGESVIFQPDAPAVEEIVPPEPVAGPPEDLPPPAEFVP